MTHLVDRRIRRSVTLLALVGLLVVPGVLSRQLFAQNDQDRWEPAIKKFEEADKLSPPPQNAIVFIGASSIVRWNLKESFPELGAQAINRGFGGSLAADSTRYADRIVIPYKPRMVVFYAGDNDVEANHTPQQIADDFAAFDRKVHAALPRPRSYSSRSSQVSAGFPGSSRSKAPTRSSSSIAPPTRT
jgi:hypothetical protein